MSIETSKGFLSDKNIKMLWEVILDEDIIINKNREEITLINQIFLKVAQQFYDKEKSLHKDLIGINKKFISVIINILSQTFPKPKQIAIHENVKENLITAEEIQASRVNAFERNLLQKQEEFTKAMALPAIETPIFADNAKDEPIGELDSIIKKTIAERNLEMQKITSSYNKENVNSWIQSSETSLRVEKTKEKELAMQNIKIQDYDLPKPQMRTKHISWAENFEDTEPQIVPGLKLKITEPGADSKKIHLEEKIDNLEKKIDIIFAMIEKLTNLSKHEN